MTRRFLMEMIRQIFEEDRNQVMDYLHQESAFNLFIIGDIENFGMHTAFQRVYGEFEGGHLKSVFLRYRENAVYYADTIRFNPSYLKLFKEDPFEFISGKSELMALIAPHLHEFHLRRMYFCKANRLQQDMIIDEKIHVLSTKEEAAKLYDMLSTIDEFQFSMRDKNRFIEQKTEDRGMGITLYIEKDNEIVSTVATTAENTKSAMVVAVATHKNFRGHGYASKLLAHLMRVYFDGKGKELCLFYNNPDAGKIYHRLGFETIGTWDVYSIIKA